MDVDSANNNYMGKYSSIISETIGKWQYMGFYFDRVSPSYTSTDIFIIDYYNSLGTYTI